MSLKTEINQLQGFIESLEYMDSISKKQIDVLINKVLQLLKNIVIDEKKVANLESQYKELTDKYQKLSDDYDDLLENFNNPDDNYNEEEDEEFDENEEFENEYFKYLAEEECEREREEEYKRSIKAKKTNFNTPIIPNYNAPYLSNNSGADDLPF